MLEDFIKNTLEIPPHHVPQVADLFQEKQLSKNEYLVRKGGYCKQMVLIESGYLRCHFQNDAKEITYWIYWQGHLVTDSSSFILNTPANEKEAAYWELNRNIFWDAIDEDNELVELQQASFNVSDDYPMTIGSFEKLILQFEGLIDDVLEDRLKLTDF